MFRACINCSRQLLSLKISQTFKITESLVNVDNLYCLLELITCETRRKYFYKLKAICEYTAVLHFSVQIKTRNLPEMNRSGTHFRSGSRGKPHI